MRHLSCLLLWGCVCVPVCAQDVPTETRFVYEKTEQVFVPNVHSCTVRGICDLRRVIFRAEHARFPPKDEGDIDALGADFYASYETAAIDDLPNYAFVQFIRGCVYSSFVASSGEVETAFTVVRRSMGKGRYPFRHREWSIDSNDLDPIFASESSVSENREYFAEWNDTPGSWTPGKLGNFYGESVPSYPLLYVSDNAPLGYAFNGSAQNVSLQFRMCLYKTRDVPQKIAHGESIAAPAIVCGTWESSNIYNHARGVFEHPPGIVDVCARPFTLEEERRNQLISARDPKS